MCSEQREMVSLEYSRTAALTEVNSERNGHVWISPTFDLSEMPSKNHNPQLVTIVSGSRKANISFDKKEALWLLRISIFFPSLRFGNMNTFSIVELFPIRLTPLLFTRLLETFGFNQFRCHAVRHSKKVHL